MPLSSARSNPFDLPLLEGVLVSLQEGRVNWIPKEHLYRMPGGKGRHVFKKRASGFPPRINPAGLPDGFETAFDRNDSLPVNVLEGPPYTQFVWNR